MRRDKRRILVVDDEQRYVWAIRSVLKTKGYEVLTARDGRTAIELATLEEPDLIVLDIKMPGMDGFEVCQQIREFSAAPVIMLTALAEDVDKVRGLDVGADDYVTKPFSAEELLARVRAALRRVELSERQDPKSTFEAGDLVVDFAGQRVFVNGREVTLPPLEYRLLCELIQHAGRVLVPEYLLDRVWGVGYEGETHLVRKAIYRLRQNIEPTPGDPQYVLTKAGSGYLFISSQ